MGSANEVAAEYSWYSDMKSYEGGRDILGHAIYIVDNADF